MTEKSKKSKSEASVKSESVKDKSKKLEDNKANASNKPNKKDVKNIFKERKRKLETNTKYVCILITHFFSIILLTISIIYYDDCPAETKIPIILIIYSVLHIIAGTLIEIIFFFFREESDSLCKLSLQITSIFCYIGAIVAFILACVWIYCVAFPEFESNTADYCDSVLYWIAFVYVTIVLAIILLVMLIFCCICCCLCCVFCLAACGLCNFPYWIENEDDIDAESNDKSDERKSTKNQK